MQRSCKISRRSFFTHSFALITTIPLSVRLFATPNLREKARIGIVGSGNRGHFLVDLLTRKPDVEIRAIADIIPEHAQRTKKLCEERQSFVPELYCKDEHHYEELVQRDDLDCVICATPWEWHTPVAVATMQAGKISALEMPGAVTLEECWKLIKTSEETKQPCYLLENVCYFQEPLTILRMIREGLFGEVLHAQGGYQHDCRFLLADDKGNLTWRGEIHRQKHGNTYPTHPLGPISQWMDINRGDRFISLVSMSTKAVGVQEYFRGKFGKDHPLCSIEYTLGDVNTTMLQTAQGKTVLLYHDTSLPRPYDLIFRVQGTKGIYYGTFQKIYLEGISPQKDSWEDFSSYKEKYAHPLWVSYGRNTDIQGGHGLGDYITVRELVRAIRTGITSLPDVYDNATWSAVVDLSERSVLSGGQRVDFPDFTNGRWKETSPLPIIELPQDWS